VNEEAMTHWGAVGPKNKKKNIFGGVKVTNESTAQFFPSPFTSFLLVPNILLNTMVLKSLCLYPYLAGLFVKYN